MFEREIFLEIFIEWIWMRPKVGNIWKLFIGPQSIIEILHLKDMNFATYLYFPSTNRNLMFCHIEWMSKTGESKTDTEEKSRNSNKYIHVFQYTTFSYFSRQEYAEK
jgi:hypothetical protein